MHDGHRLLKGEWVPSRLLPDKKRAVHTLLSALLLEGLLDLLGSASALGGRSFFRKALALGTHVGATGFPWHCCEG